MAILRARNQFARRDRIYGDLMSPETTKNRSQCLQVKCPFFFAWRQPNRKLLDTFRYSFQYKFSVHVSADTSHRQTHGWADRHDVYNMRFFTTMQRKKRRQIFQDQELPPYARMCVCEFSRFCKQFIGISANKFHPSIYGATPPSGPGPPSQDTSIHLYSQLSPPSSYPQQL
jgi:hypothetical protein